MPDNEIAPRTTTPVSEQLQYAEKLAKSDLLPRAYHNRPHNILVAKEWASTLSMNLMTVMQQLVIIDGRPTPSAQLVASLVRRAGHNLRVAGDDQRAVCEITRRDDPGFVFKAVWTIERARASGLANKGNWRTYPGAMLKARAITEAARDACPEALLGLAYTAEELTPTTPTTHAATVPTLRLIPAATPQPAPEPEPEPEPDLDPEPDPWDEDAVIVDNPDDPT